MENTTNNALFYLVLALFVHFGFWAASMYQVSWFRVTFLLLFDKKYDRFFENTLIIKTLESSLISFFILGFYGVMENQISVHYMLWALPLAWAFSFYHRMLEITNICSRCQKDYRRIEKIKDNNEFPFFCLSVPEWCECEPDIISNNLSTPALLKQ